MITLLMILFVIIMGGALLGVGLLLGPVFVTVGLIVWVFLLFMLDVKFALLVIGLLLLYRMVNRR